MRTLNALEAKSRFGELSEIVQHGPVAITKRGRPAFVTLSVKDFERWSAMEKRQRQNVVAALKEAQDAVARHNLTDAQKADLLSDFNLVADD